MARRQAQIRKALSFKDNTLEKRRKIRENNENKAKQAMEEGNKEDFNKYIQCSIKVTNNMKLNFIK
jgi:hypothetical protein